MSRAVRLSLLTVAMVLLATGSFAMVREVSFEELTQLSDTTMEVVVVNSYAEWNAEHTAIFTHYVVEPLRQVGGTSRGSRFELLFAGGRTTDGKQMIVTEVPTMEVGGQYILFLHPREVRHAAATVGMWQGALRVIKNPETQRDVVVDAQERLIERGPDGKLHRGRSVKVDHLGFMTDAVVEPEPGMEADPILKDPQGRVIPMQRAPRGVSVDAAPALGQPVDADTLMNMVEQIRRDAQPSSRIAQ